METPKPVEQPVEFELQQPAGAPQSAPVPVNPPEQGLAKSEQASPLPAPITAQPGALVPAPVQDAHAVAKLERVKSISRVLEDAYTKCSQVPISKDESVALRASFPDHSIRTGARGKDNLLYIEHACLSDRLTDVLGMGQWALIRRTERFDPKASTIYADCVLLIRGAVAAEAIGENDYNPTNRIMGYSDALKAAESNALSRCCQRLGIGSQVWDKGYCEQWLEKYDAKHRPERPTAPAASAPASAPAQAQPSAPAAHAAPPAKKQMSYFIYDEAQPYIVPKPLHHEVEPITVNPFKNSQDCGKAWTEYSDDIKLQAAWSYCHDVIERDKDNAEKNISMFIGVLKGVSSELVMRGHQVHTVFE